MEESTKCEIQPKAENCNEKKDGNNTEKVTKHNNLNNSSVNKKNKNKNKNKNTNTNKYKQAKKTNDLKRINKNKNKKNKKNEKNKSSKNVGKNKRNGKGEQINSIVDFLKKNESKRVQKEGIKELKKNGEKQSVEISQQKRDKKKEKKKEKKNNSTIEEKNERTVFVGNIPLNDVSNLKLLKILGINKSLVESVRFRSLPLEEKYANNKKLGVMLKKFTDVKDNKNALIRMKRKEDVSLLLKKNGTVYNGYVLRVNKFGDQSNFSRKKSVCVKNLDRSLSEKDLYELFKGVDEIKGVRILRDLENSQSRGVAFILFENRDSVKKAIDLFNGKEVKDRVITVEKVLQEKESDKNDKSKFDFKRRGPNNFKNFKPKNKNRFKQRQN
ncbi:RNA-binding protein 34, putative [Plasmodium chabaudi chabaudi]|uniref:RNA-binding protein 34, putative n=1 Tax=Plasmodium chabaudi chabaudi TaxID=31271 RepID=A0A4V0K3D0_PLACU|nr:RNA-binding protein 34, putative [Plasmodium chabaudi chabaudi]VTZ67380.1 RNA-binding protein 34, putative [Plasmodium chabaudi chabaudi]|eukprot:XP_016655148.1 large subunit rRNA processing RRM protein, putative [Plasmodium chabaudi chabaudi]